MFCAVVWQRLPAVSIGYRGVANGHTLAVFGPEEVVFDHLDGLKQSVLSDVGEIRLSQIDPRQRAWLREVEAELVLPNDPRLVKMFYVEGSGRIAVLGLDMEWVVASHAHNAVDRLRNSALGLDKEELEVFNTGSEQDANRVSELLACERRRAVLSLA